MQKVFTAVLLLTAAGCVTMSEGRSVSAEQESIMSAAIATLITDTVDENGLRFLVPGIVRLCFHDCVHVCDGCIDTRRKVQGGNNGLDLTWKPLRFLWERRFQNFCSRADFFALACKVTSDFAGLRGIEEGICSNLNPDPNGPNECLPNIKVLWGRITCDIPQLVDPLRNIPDANQDPYVWFEENMQFTPREAVCIMGSHTLGRLHANETGFSGDYSSELEVLDNEFFKMMLEPGKIWKQTTKFEVVDGFPETRQQWEDPSKTFTRVNTDMMLIYKLGELDDTGATQCVVPPQRATQERQQCELQSNVNIVVELANDNKAFIKCFGEAMSKMLHNGYPIGDLVPTGVEIPPPTTSTRSPQGSTTARTVVSRRNQRRLQRRGGRRNQERANRRRGNRQRRRQNGGGRRRNRVRAEQPPASGLGRVADLTNRLLGK